MNNEPVAELVLEQMAVGDASSLRVNWLTDSYPPAGTKLYTHPAELTKELDALLCSVMGEAYLGEEKEQALVKAIRQQYTHPVKKLDRELLDKTIIDQQNEIKDLRKNLDVALMIVNKSELTDEEIIFVYQNLWQFLPNEEPDLAKDIKKFARAILRKAQEK